MAVTLVKYLLSVAATLAENEGSLRARNNTAGISWREWYWGMVNNNICNWILYTR